MIWFKKIYCCFPNLLPVLAVLFAFQVTIISISANPIILDQGHQVNISETYTYDEIESSI